MKLEIDLQPTPDTSIGKLLTYSHGAQAQLKLDGAGAAARLTFYFEGRRYAAPVAEILAAFVAQLPHA